MIVASIIKLSLNMKLVNCYVRKTQTLTSQYFHIKAMENTLNLSLKRQDEISKGKMYSTKEILFSIANKLRFFFKNLKNCQVGET